MLRSAFDLCGHRRSPGLRLQLGGPMDGLADARIGPAAADVRHCAVDLGVGRLRFLFEKRNRGHDLPRLTITALRNVELDLRQLDRMRSVGGQPLDRGDALAGNGSNRIAA